MDLVSNLRQLRVEKGLSQAAVAEVLQTTQQQYSKYELGMHEIPVHHIITLCKFYQVSSDWVLGLSDKR